MRASLDRSAIMARIRKTDTRPEMMVRRAAHRLGYRFRLHRPDLPGTPDLVFPGRRAVIFVHGCFWHQHDGCRLARKPKSRPDYWLPKLRRNQERDSAALVELARMGWRTLVIWECKLRSGVALDQRLRTFLEGEPAV